MSLLFIIPLGLVLWFASGLAMALLIGPVLARNDEAPQPPGGDEGGEQ